MNIQHFWRALSAGARYFAGARLRGADLRGARLHRLNLRKADLRGARLDDADLRGADMRNANLRGARFEGADMTGADLRGAHIAGADWTNATLRDAALDTGEWAIIEEQGGIRSITGASIHHRPGTLLCQLGACSEAPTQHCHICTVPLCPAHVRRMPPFGTLCPLCAQLHGDNWVLQERMRRRREWLDLAGPDTPDTSPGAPGAPGDVPGCNR